MKKSLLLGIVGLAASIASSQAQGFVSLDNYSSAVSPLITYGAGSGGVLGAGITGAQWTVGLYFGQGTFVAADPSDPLLALGTGPGSTTPLLDPAFPGKFASVSSFQATAAAVPGPVTFMVVAYDGASYATSAIFGHSASFTVTPQPGTTFPPLLGDSMSTFAVTGIPEPSTLALAGLGIAGLMAFRRRS